MLSGENILMINCILRNDKCFYNFRARLNSLIPSIKFKAEVEEDNTSPLSVVLIHRFRRSYKFYMNWKPTNILSYVHFYSSHHTRMKPSLSSSMFIRALSEYSPEYVDGEINRMYDIGANLIYGGGIMLIILLTWPGRLIITWTLNKKIL